MSWVNFYTLCAVMVAVSAFSETVTVPAGKTVAAGANKTFSGETLIKDGQGTLDLTGARLMNQGLEIREGTVLIARQKLHLGPVTARYLRWNVNKTRPGKTGAPEWANSGFQFSEFQLFLDGKPVAFPAGTKPYGSHSGGGKNEGIEMGYDGDVKTKCYRSAFAVEFGADVSFNGYSFITANDAIGRDPESWTLEIGHKKNGKVVWSVVGGENGFSAPKERFTAAGKIFSLVVNDVIPPGYSVKICGKGVLALKEANEMLENVSGDGLINMENASVDFAPECAFKGSVSGSGQVRYR